MHTFLRKNTHALVYMKKLLYLCSRIVYYAVVWTN